MSSPLTSVAQGLELPELKAQYKDLASERLRSAEGASIAVFEGGLIPDGQGALSIPLQLSGAEGQAWQLKLTIKHPLLDDLLVIWEDDRGRQTELIRGVEEVPLDGWLVLPGTSGSLEGKLIVQDLVKGIGGRVLHVEAKQLKNFSGLFAQANPLLPD